MPGYEGISVRGTRVSVVHEKVLIFYYTTISKFNIDNCTCKKIQQHYFDTKVFTPYISIYLYIYTSIYLYVLYICIILTKP